MPSAPTTAKNSTSNQQQWRQIDAILYGNDDVFSNNSSSGDDSDDINNYSSSDHDRSSRRRSSKKHEKMKRSTNKINVGRKVESSSNKKKSKPSSTKRSGGRQQPRQSRRLQQQQQQQVNNYQEEQVVSHNDGGQANCGENIIPAAYWPVAITEFIFVIAITVLSILIVSGPSTSTARGADGWRARAEEGARLAAQVYHQFNNRDDMLLYPILALVCVGISVYTVVALIVARKYHLVGTVLWGKGFTCVLLIGAFIYEMSQNDFMSVLFSSLDTGRKLAFRGWFNMLAILQILEAGYIFFVCYKQQIEDEDHRMEGHFVVKGERVGRDAALRYDSDFDNVGDGSSTRRSRSTKNKASFSSDEDSDDVEAPSPAAGQYHETMPILHDTYYDAFGRPVATVAY